MRDEACIGKTSDQKEEKERAINICCADHLAG